MNPSLKKFLVNFAKHGVNALLTNATLMTMFSEWGKINTWAEWKHILFVALGCVVGRELTVWLPKLLAWSQSTNGGS